MRADLRERFFKFRIEDAWTDLLMKIAARSSLFVNLTITTLSTELARILEPRAPRPDLRLKAIRELIDAGVPAGVICAPVVPGITDAPADLDALAKAAREAGARYIFANALFLKPCSASVFLPFLEKEFPQLVQTYRERYGDNTYLPDAYRKRLQTLMAKLRKKYGFPSREEHSMAQPQPRQYPVEQLALFG